MSDLKYKHLSDMMDTVTKLKSDLALRETNFHIGSGLGGNPSELMFLLTSKIEVGVSSTNDLYITDFNGGIKFFFPNQKEQDGVLLRNTFTDFYNKRHDKNHYTWDDLIDSELLGSIDRSYIGNWQALHALIKCIHKTNQLKARLQDKLKLIKLIRPVHDKELAEVEKHFYLEMEVPVEGNLLDENIFKRMIRKHPVWGVKLSQIDERYNQIYKSLLSEEDLNHVKIINSFYDPIKLLCLRTIIGIETIVHLNLDDYITQCAFLEKAPETK